MALSKTQTKRLGSLLSVMFKDGELPKDVIDELLKEGFVELQGVSYILSEKGRDERLRLCTLAGLNILYSSERSAEKEIQPTKS